MERSEIRDRPIRGPKPRITLMLIRVKMVAGRAVEDRLALPEPELCDLLHIGNASDITLDRIPENFLPGHLTLFLVEYILITSVPTGGAARGRPWMGPGQAERRGTGGPW